MKTVRLIVLESSGEELWFLLKRDQWFVHETEEAVNASTDSLIRLFSPMTANKGGGAKWIFG
jgi:hypothetical protein